MKYLSRFLAAFNRIDATHHRIFFTFACFSLVPGSTLTRSNISVMPKLLWIKAGCRDPFSLPIFPGSRLLFQYIAGFALKYLSFEQLAFYGRMTMYHLFAFPVAALARLLRLNNILLVFWLSIMYIPHQNFFGGEWIFGGLESKTFAYLFILWSLYFLLKNKYCGQFCSLPCRHTGIFWRQDGIGLYLFIYMLIYHRQEGSEVYPAMDCFCQLSSFP